MSHLNMLYRGPLSSCNYGCLYCPFAKHHETAAELAKDRSCLKRFTSWIVQQSDRTLGVLFTPWGEALTRRWYRETMIALSHRGHVARVAAQTNLSFPVDWTADADRKSLALWCTFHPSETTRGKFVEQCRQLDDLGIRYSVGVVGLQEHMPEIELLRKELNPNVYLWINAFKRQADYYDAETRRRMTDIDSLFPFNRNHASRGKACGTGQTTISVDGNGDIRRCHFVPTLLGNLYRDPLETILRPRLCPSEKCGCHIGYVHMPELGLQEVFQENILERIPATILSSGNAQHKLGEPDAGVAVRS